MASNYPGSLDAFDSIASDKKTSDVVGGRTHRDMHNDLGDAIEAVQAELGTDPAGASATVKARLEVIEANNWVTSDRIAADAVGASEIAAGAVGSSELADAAVTAAKLAVQPGNLLTANQASVETDTTGWLVHSNCSIARSTAEASHGSASLAVTATATADLYVKTLDTTSGVAVTAGQTYSAHLEVKTNGTADTGLLRIYWYNSGGSNVGTTDSAAIAPNSSGWTTYLATGVTPAGSAYASIYFIGYAAPAGRIYYLDKAGLWVGAGGLWALPGQVITGTGTRVNPSDTAQVQIWNSATSGWITV